MFKSMVFYGLSAVTLLMGSASYAEVCDSYSVVPGDTLRLISERYYGARDLSPIIYSANMEVVGEDPNTIEIGMALEIPCRDGMQIPQLTAFIAVVETGLEASVAPQFFAKAGETPFMGVDNTGLIPDILAAALTKGGYAGVLDIARPDSTSEVLQTSTQPSALLTFPWVLPSCNAPSTLSPQSAYLCENYTFSDPLYEITLGIFTTADSPLASATTAAAFSSSTICVPQFHTDDLLRTSGIVAANGVSIIAPNYSTCLDGLKDGTYDAMVADYQSVNAFTTDDSGVVDVPGFAKTTTLHAIAYSTNPAALEVLKMADAGLKQILTSGEWFGIVNQHLAGLNN